MKSPFFFPSSLQTFEQQAEESVSVYETNITQLTGAITHFFLYLLASLCRHLRMNVPQHSLEVRNALKPREITGDLYQRSRPAIISDKKKEPVDSARQVYVQYGRLLAYAYDPRDVCGTCRHDRMAVLGSKMSTSGTRGLGFPVGCASDQTRWWYRRPTLCTAGRMPPPSRLRLSPGLVSSN
jgi:hypothetical protein